jgi:hypothetical protein
MGNEHEAATDAFVRGAGIRARACLRKLDESVLSPALECERDATRMAAAGRSVEEHARQCARQVEKESTRARETVVRAAAAEEDRRSEAERAFREGELVPWVQALEGDKAAASETTRRLLAVVEVAGCTDPDLKSAAGRIGHIEEALEQTVHLLHGTVKDSKSLRGGIQEMLDRLYVLTREN